jgi:CRP-like cAMP-binding protein
MIFESLTDAMRANRLAIARAADVAIREGRRSEAMAMLRLYFETLLFEHPALADYFDDDHLDDLMRVFATALDQADRSIGGRRGDDHLDDL